MKKILLMLAAAAVSGTTASAELSLNQVRVNVDGIDRVQWSEEIILDNGTAAPYSLIYEDTTYLPLRKMGEFLDKKVEWDSSTRTIYLYDTELVKTTDVGTEFVGIYNSVNINIDGNTLVHTGENYNFIPSSIIYNDTTYLPMRSLCELLGREIYWNGDSKTVSITKKRENESFIAAKADSNTIVWEYSTYKCGDNTYLAVRDKLRGYDRVYRYVGDLKADDDGIELVRLSRIYNDRSANPYNVNKGYVAEYCKIPYLSDENSQDGTVTASYQMPMNSLINGDVFFSTTYIYPSTMARYRVFASDIYTGETLDGYNMPIWSSLMNLTVGEDGALYYTLSGTGPSFNDYRLEFDYETKTFGEPVLIRTRG